MICGAIQIMEVHSLLRPHQMLERDIESEVTEYAESLGCIHLKLNVLGRIGWPDHIYLWKFPRLVFIEFKRPGEKPRKIQGFIHGKLRALGWNIQVVDNVTRGRAILRGLTKDDPQL